jgi:hypothetical protein
MTVQELTQLSVNNPALIEALIDKFIDADGKYHFKDTGICIYE